MKHDTQPRHLLVEEHHAPVIHHYGEDRTVLERWIRRGLEKGAAFWLPVILGVAILTFLGLWLTNSRSSASPGSQAWSDMLVAQSPDDLLKISETYGKTTAGHWALLQSAMARYQEGLANLPENREAAKPLLNQAFDWYKRVYNESTDPYLKRLAAIGMARSLESRNELDEAIKQYNEVAKAWPDTDEGKYSARRAKELASPEAVAFYEKFYTFKRAEATLPPRGSSPLGLPPIFGGSGTPSTSGDLPKNVFPTVPESTEPKPAKPSSDLPDVFPSAPTPEMPKSTLPDSAPEKEKTPTPAPTTPGEPTPKS